MVSEREREKDRDGGRERERERKRERKREKLEAPKRRNSNLPPKKNLSKIEFSVLPFRKKTVALAQVVEHQATKAKVSGSNTNESFLVFYPYNLKINAWLLI